MDKLDNEEIKKFLACLAVIFVVAIVVILLFIAVVWSITSFPWITVPVIIVFVFSIALYNDDGGDCALVIVRECCFWRNKDE